MACDWPTQETENRPKNPKSWERHFDKVERKMIATKIKARFLKTKQSPYFYKLWQKKTIFGGL
jgi:hypothetical protein